MIFDSIMMTNATSSENKGNKSIICFDVIDALFFKLYNDKYYTQFKINGFPNEVNIDLLSFPTCLNASALSRMEVEKQGFANPYEILNELYKKAGISTVSEDDIKQEKNYIFFLIEFCTNKETEMKTLFKYIYNTYIIFFCSTTGSEVNDFRLLYTKEASTNLINNMLSTELVDVNNPKEPAHEYGVKNLEIVLQAACQYLDVKIPEDLERLSSENLMTKEASLEDFEEFANLVTMGDFEKKELKKLSKKLYTIYKKNIDKSDLEKYYTEVTEEHFDFFRSVYYWESDWKFDPEDAEYWISEMIDADFTFVHPSPENYGEEIFPNIQSALAKLGLTLMSCDTYGDFYIFFVVKLSDVDRILELSKLTKIEVQKM